MPRRRQLGRGLETARLRGVFGAECAAVILAVVHHHFRPGGVRRVIELATPHVAAHWPERIRQVVLATGEAPDAAWLGRFRASLGGTRVRVMVEPAFGYVSEWGRGRGALEAAVRRAVFELVVDVTRAGGLIWAHNLGLGRNLYLARDLTFECHCCGVPLVVHHHDWWFENRWHLFGALREPGFCKLDAIARAILPASSLTFHAGINQADASILERHFPGQAAWLPNPVEPRHRVPEARVAAAAAFLREQLGDGAPVWLLPCRLLRRKNVAEALLLTRWLRPEAWVVTTGGVSSAEEQPYAEALERAAQVQGWRLRLGVLQGRESTAPSVSELLAASECVLLTSLQEGFGLPYVESAAAGRPLVARRLSNVAPDLARLGFTFPHDYKEIVVDPGLFDWEAERERQRRRYAAWKDSMPRAASQLVGRPALLASGDAPVPVAFSRLTLTAQLEVLAQPVEHSWDRCADLNPFLKSWRRQAGAGGLGVTPWPRSAQRCLGGAAYAKRFVRLAWCWPGDVRRSEVSQAAQMEFLRRRLRAECVYPLLWDTNP